MDKLEKCYYAVIENKKRGKFSGAGPIQVAKKVASKKLKEGKEMEFYLDEVAGKKKRLGPYQARKDKKSGRVVVVKGRKVMKGGLTADFINKLQDSFRKNRDVSLNKGQTLQNLIIIVDIEYRNREIKPFIFFNCKENITKNITKNDKIISYQFNYAVYEDENGFLLLFYESSHFEIGITYSNFFEFFLSNRTILNKSDILLSLINSNNVNNSLYNVNNNIESLKVKRIKEKANEIKKFLDSNSQFRIISYIEKIQLCVYSDSTFGIFDETEPYKSKLLVKNPDYNNQIFLIMKKSFIGGFEPVIFLRKPIERRSIFQTFNFDVCIYEKNGSFRIHIIPQNQNPFFSISNNDNSYNFSSDIFLNYEELPVDNLKYYCETLQKIPPEFGRFQRLRAISSGILDKIPEDIARSQRSTPPLSGSSENNINNNNRNHVEYMTRPVPVLNLLRQ